ncbi:PREDICTED: uncharacterized protein LOC105558165 [Vollenhovia emeryi]|uniref:uncharacterized protein LOC105558165 n=1 Tax=Vollenhovia emeryi TaxID=411798 RepID=UPI0005F4C6C6|nr:PREDICTED: uncharacterized protein LOC105558165 [Vollenhovia emeryi]
MIVLQSLQFKMASNNKEMKQKQVCLRLAQKLELIKKLEQGISVTDVCEIYGIHRRTVSNIRKSSPYYKTPLIPIRKSYCQSNGVAALVRALSVVYEVTGSSPDGRFFLHLNFIFLN